MTCRTGFGLGARKPHAAGLPHRAGFVHRFAATAPGMPLLPRHD